MVFCRVRALPEDEEPRESREGLCSLTDMVRQLLAVRNCNFRL